MERTEAEEKAAAAVASEASVFSGVGKMTVADVDEATGESAYTESAVAKKTLAEILAADSEDESLRKYKVSSAQPGDACFAS